MPRQLIRTLIVEISDNVDEAAEVTMISAKPWKAMLDAMTEHGTVKFDHRTETMEVRKKPEAGAKRGRKPNGAKAPAVQHTTTTAPDF